MTEQELIALYAEVARPLLGWLVRRTAERDQAQDVFSETWARVVAKDRRMGRIYEVLPPTPETLRRL